METTWGLESFKASIELLIPRGIHADSANTDDKANIVTLALCYAHPELVSHLSQLRLGVWSRMTTLQMWDYRGNMVSSQHKDMTR